MNIRNKTIAIIAILVFIVSLAACKQKDQSESDSSLTNSSLSDSSSISNSIQSGSEAQSDGSSAASVASEPPAPIQMNGDFLCLDTDRYPDDRAPLLKLNTDSTFVLRLNLGDGLGNVSGNYERQGHNLVLTIIERETTDYLGSEISQLTFSVLDEDHLTYTGAPIGLSRTGNQFTRDGMPKIKSTSIASIDPANTINSSSDNRTDSGTNVSSLPEQATQRSGSS